MKILAVGNSFSQDATAYLKNFADAASMDLKVVNLFIPSCSLERHAANIRDNNPSYQYECNGQSTEKFVSILDTLKEDEWDIVTMQQASRFSGIRESYDEDAKYVADFLKENAPQAKLWFHETWAYDYGVNYPTFEAYDYSQEKMYKSIRNSVKEFCDREDLPIIPCGEVINALRKTPLFDCTNSGESLCRDGLHMSVTYGRYALAATWFKFLMGGDLETNSYLPKAGDRALGLSIGSEFRVDLEKIAQIKSVINYIQRNVSLEIF